MHLNNIPLKKIFIFSSIEENQVRYVGYRYVTNNDTAVFAIRVRPNICISDTENTFL